MRMIALIATRQLIYGTRALGAGERFDATPIDAAVLTYRRHAAFAPLGPIAPPSPAPPVEPISTDEEAEPSGEASGRTDEDGESPARRKRTYKRRDLQAED